MSYYGGNFWRARWSTWRDARAGRTAQANGRWGFLRPPGERGPVLWLQTYADAEELQLALELVRAITDKRRDLRVALTFEKEPEDLAQMAAGIPRLGLGFGPCDHPAALRRSLERLRPLRAMTVGGRVRPGWRQQLSRSGVSALAVASEPEAAPPASAGAAPWEAVYPRSRGQWQRWQAQGLGGTRLQEPVDFASLITIAQVEPNFRSLALGSRSEALFWVTGVEARDLPAWMEAWQSWPQHREALLFLESRASLGSLPTLSNWDRSPLAPGSILWVDSPRWRPALAAAATAIHAEELSPALTWQLFAGGRPCSVAPTLELELPTTTDLTSVLARPADRAGVFAHWMAMWQDAHQARERGDALRRLFWQVRRDAGERLPELLQRVFDW
ncbi:MAG: hypothetical protein ACP5M3_03185 [Acidithiobacillus sp.]